jgi:hypothetical protein
VVSLAAASTLQPSLVTYPISTVGKVLHAFADMDAPYPALRDSALRAALPQDYSNFVGAGCSFVSLCSAGRVAFVC